MKHIQIFSHYAVMKTFIFLKIRIKLKRYFRVAPHMLPTKRQVINYILLIKLKIGYLSVIPLHFFYTTTFLLYH